jgi:glycerol-3-phosphate acyltransferase PlsY
MPTFWQILSIVAAYLIGAIPFGIIFSRLFSDVDVRTVGSGNIGATNVLRAAGKKAAILTLVADSLKGLLPVLIVRTILQDDMTTVLSGAAAVLGHNFPVYLNFKGGKGVATSYGVVFAVAPWTGLFCLAIWLVAALLWRYSSLAALIAFACYPILTVSSTTHSSKPYALLSLFIFGMIYYRHRENIKRLLAGVEPKIGSSRT